MHNIHSLVTWFCAQLTRAELLDALVILLEVFDGSRDDIKLKSRFREEHPNYRLFDVDTTPPLVEAPPEPTPTRDWREFLLAYERQHGKAMKPVGRRPGAQSPPASEPRHSGSAATRVPAATRATRVGPNAVNLVHKSRHSHRLWSLA